MAQEEFSDQIPKNQTESTAISSILTSVIERVNEGFVVLNKDWRYAYVNNKAAQMLNREKPGDLIGRHIWTEYPEGVGQPFYHAYIKAMEIQETIYLEEYYEPWDRWFENRIYPSEDGLAIYFTEITDRKRAERALRETEERLRLAVKAANVGLWDWDIQTNKIYFSPEWKHQIGYHDHEIPNNFGEWQSRVHPEDLEAAFNIIQTYIANPYPNYHNEFRFRHRDGTYLWILAQADLVCDEQGKPVRMLGSHIDITKRKQAEFILRQREQQLASIYDTVGDVIFYLTVEESGYYRFASVNQAFLSTTGLQYDAIVGKRVDEVIPEPSLALVLEKYEVAIRERKGVRWEETSDYPNGRLTGEVSIAPVFGENGRCTHLVGAVHDITQRKQAEENLRASEENLNAAQESTKVGSWEVQVGGSGSQLHWSRQMFRLFDRDPAEGVPSFEEFPELIHPEDRAFIQRVLKNLTEGQAPTIQEFRSNPERGALRYLLPTWNLERDQTGKPVKFMGTLQDITEQKAAEAAILRYSQRLALLGKIDKQIINARSSKEITHVVLKSIQQLIPCQRAAVIFTDENTSESIIFAIHTEDPLDVPTQTRAPLIRSERSAPLRAGQVIVIPDLRQVDPPVSELAKQAMQAGLRSSLTAPLLVSGNLLGYLSLGSRTPNFFTIEHQEIIQEIANPLAIALHQSHLYEQIEQHNLELEQRVAERTAELQKSEARYRAIIEDQTDLVCRFLPGGILTFVNQTYWQYFKQTPEQLLGTNLFSLFSDASRSTVEACIASLNHQHPVSSFEIGETASDGQVRWFHWSECMLFDEAGNFVEYQGVGRDITERKLAEDQLHQMLEQAMRMSELKSRFTSMVSHEFRTPLTAILSSSDLLKRYGERMTNEKKLEYLDSIQMQVKHLTNLLEDILTVGKAETVGLEFTPTLLNLEVLCRQFVEELQLTTTAHRLEFYVIGECADGYVDAKLLRHILSNLLSNAAKYSPDKTVVAFTLDCNSDQILFRIQDQGIGIPEADQQRLFEAFHRGSNAKNIPGTGLGLAIVKQAVDLHGGIITFESQEGIGTTFRVALPRTFTEKIL